MLAAFVVCQILGIIEDKIRSSLTTFALPKGRFEIVYDKDFTVMIDFAHTPNSIRQLLSSIKKDARGKLIHVFGSAGLRDDKKRPDMGRASGEYADVSILTEEDFRTEKIEDINEAVISGFVDEGFEEYVVETDRQKAINYAIELAGKGDVVVLTGKAHERSLSRGKKEYDWDEFEAVEKALKLKSSPAK